MGIHIMPPLYKMVIAPPVPAYGPEETHSFYPDAHPEVSSVDGRTQHWTGAGQTWASIRGGVGSYAIDTETTIIVRIDAWDDNDWIRIYRDPILFDTTSIPSGAKKISAYLRLNVRNFGVYSSWVPTMCFNVFTSNPASNTALVGPDYSTFGETPLSTPKYRGDLVAGFNYWAFNAAGLAAIVPAGITKLGMREQGHDVANIAPPWVHGITGFLEFAAADWVGALGPMLSVTYQPLL